MRRLDYKIFYPKNYEELINNLNNKTIQEMNADHERYMRFKNKQKLK